MRKEVIIGLVLVTGIMLVSASYAHFPGSGYRVCCFQDVDMDSVKKFKKETLPLRDEFLTKKFELRKEIAKDKPERERIAELRKEIIDIRMKIQRKADGAGIHLWNGDKKGCCRMPVKGIINKYKNSVRL